MAPRRVDDSPARFLLTCTGKTGEPCSKCTLFADAPTFIVDPRAMLRGGPVEMPDREPRIDQWGRLIGCAILLGMPPHNYVRAGGDGGCKRCRTLPSHPIHGRYWEGERHRHGLTPNRY